MKVRKTHRYKYIPLVSVVYYYIVDTIVYEVILSAIALTILNITALRAVIARRLGLYRYRLGSAF